MAYQLIKIQAFKIENIFKVIALIILLVFAQGKLPITAAETEEAPAKQPKIPLEPLALRNDRLIANQLREGEAKWLNTGDTEFLGIFKAGTTGKALGSVLILPSANTAPNAPGALFYLARELPFNGWHTLSISMPEFVFSGPAPHHPQEQSGGASETKDQGETKQQTPEVDASTNPENASDSQENAASLPAAKQWYEKQQTLNMEKLLERILVAEIELRAFGGKYVILAQGITAELLLELISSKVIKAEGLIILNIQHPVALQSSKIANKLTAVTIPLLDIYNQPASKAARKRKLSQKSKNYRQLYIPGNGIHYKGSEPTLFKRIRGWLKKHYAS